jgi:hypothetical protein
MGLVGTWSQIDSWYWDQSNILPIDLNRPRLILKTYDLELTLMLFLNRSVYRARNIIIASYVLSDLTTTIHLSVSKQKLILILGPLVSNNHRLYHRPMSIVFLWTHWVISLWLTDLQILICSRLIVWSWIFSFHNISLILIMMCLSWTHDLLS